MGITVDRLAELCEGAQLKFQLDRSRNLILLGMGAINGSIQLVIKPSDDGETVMFMAPYVETLAVNELRVFECLQAYMAINYRLILGCYEYDLSDGEIRFRVSVPVNDSVFTQEQFMHCLFALVSTVDGNRPVSSMIRWGGMAPNAAIEAALQQHRARIAAMQSPDRIAV